MRRKKYESQDELYMGNLLGDEWYAELEDAQENEHAKKYRAHADKAAQRQKELSEEGREIGPLPDCMYPELVEECRYDLLKFMLRFGNDDSAESSPAFPDPFCDAQLYAINVVQETLLTGGKRPLCLPRGFAKTSICEWGIAWAIAYGHQHFVLIIAAKLNLAKQMLQNVKRIMENTLYQACFPSLCYPIACLENSPGRTKGQTLNGRHTHIKTNEDMLICPTVPGTPSSGAIITTSGLDGAIRGVKIGSDRPTCIIVDDPQTNKSAESVTQTRKRWDLLTGCVQGLGGHGTRLAMVATITVIQPEDLSECILEKWGGRRFAMLRSMPKNMDMWEEYEKIRQIGARSYEKSEDQTKEANAYYLSHRRSMDEGAEAEWKTHYDPLEYSAVQHAMNLYFDNKRTFYSEYQNQPLAIFDESNNLKYEELIQKIVPIPRGVLPLDCERITAAIDIQQSCFYWIIVGWGVGFRGHVMDYGRFPSGTETVQTRYPKASEKDAFYLGLMELIPLLSNRGFLREDGEQHTIARGLADANRGLFTPQVRKACYDLSWNRHLQSVDMSTDPPSMAPYPEIWEPCFGFGMGADALLCRGAIKIGEERGDNWQRLPLVPSNLVRHTRYDTNYWKANIRTFLQASLGGTGSMTIFEGGESLHWEFLQQLLSERSNPQSGTRGTIDRWQLIPGRANHLWDCLTMAAVANAICGGCLGSGTASSVSNSNVIYRGNWAAIANRK